MGAPTGQFEHGAGEVDAGHLPPGAHGSGRFQADGTVAASHVQNPLARLDRCGREQPAPEGGEHTGTTSAANGGKVIFTGAIGDYGNAQKVDAAGKATTKGVYRLVRLKKGTVLVDIAKFAAAEKEATGSLDLATCSYFATLSAPVTIVSGTGAYHGITGSVTLTDRSGAIGALTNGKCTTKTTTPALATYTSITGSGTVTLS